MFDGEDMNHVGEMLRRISDAPFTEAPDLKRTANVVALHGVARQERIVSQFGEDAKELPLWRFVTPENTARTASSTVYL